VRRQPFRQGAEEAFLLSGGQAREDVGEEREANRSGEHRLDGSHRVFLQELQISRHGREPARLADLPPSKSIATTRAAGRRRAIQWEAMP